MTSNYVVKKQIKMVGVNIVKGENLLNIQCCMQNNDSWMQKFMR